MKYANLKLKTGNPSLDREIDQAKKKGFYYGLRSKKLSKSVRLSLEAETERDLNLLKAGFYEGMQAGIKNRKK